MNVTQRLFVNHVCFNYDKTVTIGVIPQMIDDNGKVVSANAIDFVNTREEPMIAFGVTNGRTDGEWGDKEVDQIIFAQEDLVTAATDDTPAVTKPHFAPQPIVHSY